MFLKILILFTDGVHLSVYPADSLGTLSMDDHYTDMIDALNKSDKVGSLLKFTSLC